MGAREAPRGASQGTPARWAREGGGCRGQHRTVPAVLEDRGVGSRGAWRRTRLQQGPGEWTGWAGFPGRSRASRLLLPAELRGTRGLRGSWDTHRAVSGRTTGVGVGTEWPPVSPGLASSALPIPQPCTRSSPWEPQYPNLARGSEALPTGPRGLEPLRCGRVPGSEPYHELGVAVLEGAARVPVALLLTVHHAALHGVLDLRGRGGQRGPEGRAGGPRGGVCAGRPPRPPSCLCCPPRALCGVTSGAWAPLAGVGGHAPSG